MTAMRSCDNCDASLESDDAFCPNCGAAVAPDGSAVASGSERVCPTCGVTLSPDEVFCTACGGVVDAPERPPEQAPQPDAGEESTWDAVLEQLRDVTRGRFEIEGEIGAGGMAAVYLAHEFALDRKVAIKVMSPGWLMEKGMLERFKQEAVTIAALKHPNIITVHSVEHYEQLHFFVLDYIEAGSLEGTINQYGQLPIAVVAAWLTQVGSALEFAHRRGVIHRDIKPANILLDSDGNAVVTDFGIAKVAEKSGLTMTGAAIGTPSYMSPEQCLGNALTGASDQYSLGIVAYKMLAGRTPFQGSALVQMRAHTEELPQPIAELRPDCPADLARTITCMLEKDPAKRWPTLGDTIAAFGGTLPGLSGPVRESMVGLATGKSTISQVADSITPVTPMPARTAGSGSITGSFAKHGKKLLGSVAAVATAGVALVVLWPESDPIPDPPVPMVASLEIRPQVADLVVGESAQLQATRDSAGTSLAAQEVIWTTSDSSVATVSDGQVTGMTAGSATITASSAGETSTLYLVVSEPAAAQPGQPAPTLSSVRVTPSTVSLSVGQSELLTAAPLDQRGRRMSQRAATWSARDPAIATVSANGEVTAQAQGTTVITAVIEGLRATSSVTVEAEAVASVSVTPTDVSVDIGQTSALNVEVRGASGSNLTGRPLQWQSDNPSVATVSNLGVLTGVGAGSCVITVSSGNRQAQARVTVAAAAVAAPAIDQATATAHLTSWIDRFVSDLDEAVRRKDMQAVRSAYQAEMPAADVAEWQTRFGLEADWRINPGEVFPPRSVGQSWVADFEVEIAVTSGGRTNRGPQRFFVVFEPGGDGLVLTSVEMRLSVQP